MPRRYVYETNKNIQVQYEAIYVFMKEYMFIMFDDI